MGPSADLFSAARPAVDDWRLLVLAFKFQYFTSGEMLVAWQRPSRPSMVVPKWPLPLALAEGRLLP